MINNSGPLVKVLLYLGGGIILFALLDLLVFLPFMAEAPRQALNFFYYSFLTMSLVLGFPLMRLKDSDNEQAKGAAALRGLVLHFALSIALIVLYYTTAFLGNREEVLIAVLVYIISITAYVIQVTRMK